MQLTCHAIPHNVINKAEGHFPKSSKFIIWEDYIIFSQITFIYVNLFDNREARSNASVNL